MQSPQKSENGTSSELDLIPCGEEVFSATKLFWRNPLKINIRMFYYDLLDIITIRLSDVDSKEKQYLSLRSKK